MPTVKALDHINIQTPLLAQTVRFFADVLDLVPGASPGGTSADKVTWMFDSTGRPLVHITTPGMTLADEGSNHARQDTGALHHVAFECEGHAAMLARLAQQGHAHRCRDIDSIGLRQIFVQDPNGVLLELNFRDG